MADYSVTEAAAELGLSERTLREWVRTGKAASTPAEAPRRGARISIEELERLRPLVPADSGKVRQATGSEERQPPADSGAERQAVADSGRVRELEIALAKAETERDAATGERDFLRDQVEQHARAEAELRVLMLRQSEQIQALQHAQEQKALPAPKPEKRAWWQSPEQPDGERRAWWKLWGR